MVFNTTVLYARSGVSIILATARTANTMSGRVIVAVDFM